VFPGGFFPFSPIPSLVHSDVFLSFPFPKGGVIQVFFLKTCFFFFPLFFVIGGMVLGKAKNSNPPFHCEEWQPLFSLCCAITPNPPPKVPPPLLQPDSFSLSTRTRSVPRSPVPAIVPLSPFFYKLVHIFSHYFSLSPPLLLIRIFYEICYLMSPPFSYFGERVFSLFSPPFPPLVLASPKWVFPFNIKKNLVFESGVVLLFPLLHNGYGPPLTSLFFLLPPPPREDTISPPTIRPDPPPPPSLACQFFFFVFFGFLCHVEK